MHGIEGVRQTIATIRHQTTHLHEMLGDLELMLPKTIDGQSDTELSATLYTGLHVLTLIDQAQQRMHDWRSELNWSIDGEN